MKPTPFNPDTDLPPIPFTTDHIAAARQMQQAGLHWKPHVGCFVWDAENSIEADSPFPENIYFILSMPRFLKIFGSVDAMQKSLVWLPTWHQACLLCIQQEIDHTAILSIYQRRASLNPGEELLMIYTLLAHMLNGKSV